MKTADLTILILKDTESGMYVGQIEEFPAAISQGKTIDELKTNLIDALKLLLDVQKAQLQKEYSFTKVLKRKLQFT
jgi:predicted RNase H-like HicB family nuclease